MEKLLEAILSFFEEREGKAIDPDEAVAIIQEEFEGNGVELSSPEVLFALITLVDYGELHYTPDRRLVRLSGSENGTDQNLT